MAVPHGLRGSYHPRTDHLRFNQRIPDEFPFIDYEVRSAADLAALTVLVEEFLHRCQWAATPFGLVFRAAALIQTQKTLTILRTLAADPSLCMPTPWFSMTASGPAEIEGSRRVLVGLEILQRLLLGVPWDLPTMGAHEAVDISRDTLELLTPLAFGTFRLWDTNAGIYGPDGSSVLNRTTRGIMESHASAYAIELLRSCSRGANAAWFAEHTKFNRIGLYTALEELTHAAGVTGPMLGIRHILSLADVAIRTQFVEISGLPPAADFIDSMLCYSRYDLALRDVEYGASVLRKMAQEEPARWANLDEAAILDFAVHHAATVRGHASALFKLPEIPQAPIMRNNIAAILQWRLEQIDRLDSDGETRMLEQNVIEALAYYPIMFFRVQAQMTTHSAIFEPTVERFVLLTRTCDCPVIEYDDALEAFLCNPYFDPQGVARQQITTFELAKATRRAHRGMFNHRPLLESERPGPASHRGDGSCREADQRIARLRRCGL